MGPVLERLAEFVNGDEALVRRGRYLSTTFLVDTGDTAWSVGAVARARNWSCRSTRWQGRWRCRAGS
jgi:hypothetical protein